MARGFRSASATSSSDKIQVYASLVQEFTLVRNPVVVDCGEWDEHFLHLFMHTSYSGARNIITISWYRVVRRGVTHVESDNYKGGRETNTKSRKV